MVGGSESPLPLDGRGSAGFSSPPGSVPDKRPAPHAPCPSAALDCHRPPTCLSSSLARGPSRAGTRLSYPCPSSALRRTWLRDVHLCWARTGDCHSLCLLRTKAVSVVCPQTNRRELNRSWWSEDDRGQWADGHSGRD